MDAMKRALHDGINDACIHKRPEAEKGERRMREFLLRLYRTLYFGRIVKKER